MNSVFDVSLILVKCFTYPVHNKETTSTWPRPLMISLADQARDQWGLGKTTMRLDMTDNES